MLTKSPRLVRLIAAFCLLACMAWAPVSADAALRRGAQRRDNRQNNRMDRRDNRQDNRMDRRDNRQDNRQGRRFIRRIRRASIDSLKFNAFASVQTTPFIG